MLKFKLLRIYIFGWLSIFGKQRKHPKCCSLTNILVLLPLSQAKRFSVCTLGRLITYTIQVAKLKIEKNRQPYITRVLSNEYYYAALRLLFHSLFATLQ